MPSTLTPLHSDTVRQHNRLSVYRLLHGGEALTRAELARATGLSIPTVTTILHDFGRLELIHTPDAAQTRGGRPAQRVALRTQARTVLSVDLSGPRAQAAAADLRGALRPLPAGPELGPGCEPPLLHWLLALLEHPDLGPGPARLAVSVPGVVSPQTGVVRLAPALGWHEYPLGPTLAHATGISVVLENDVNARALAERQHIGEAFRDALFVWIGEGVGASVFVGGELCRGADAAAGELGYSLLPELGGELTLGAPGPLERYLLQLTAQFCDTSGQLSLGDAPAAAAFARFAKTLGLILHNLVCVLNPEVVVIGWPADPQAQLARYLGERWRGPLSVTFRASKLDANAALRGAATAALRSLERDFCLAPVAATTFGTTISERG